MNKLILIILDGWGVGEISKHNAFVKANTPNLDLLLQQQPNVLLDCSGEKVGLPKNQVGNSEVGHTVIGSGRAVVQSLTRINSAIADASFFDNKVLNKLILNSKENNTALHIMGLLSDGGVHSHIDHILAALKHAHSSGLQKVYLHAFLDGRDTPPESALQHIAVIEDFYAKHNCGQIVSIIGRYYAMDRDKRWQRTQAAYDLITSGASVQSYQTATAALKDAYTQGEQDEFVQARAIKNHLNQLVTLNKGDNLLFMNFRSDRTKQLSAAFSVSDFPHFATKKISLGSFASLTDYGVSKQMPVVFPPININNTLGHVLAANNKRQLRISETEKYAHVTFFFNGGQDQPYELEDRILIDSPKVASYDLQPEMSAPELTKKLINAISSNSYDFIVCNYPNCDMVGHTGSFDAAVVACEAVDAAIGDIIDSVKISGYHCIITADHGNVEQMWDDENSQPHTAHTNNQVPCIYYGNNAYVSSNGGFGTICDLAPTILSFLDLSIPVEMSSKVLFNTSSYI